MALLKINRNTIELEVNVGVLEEYQPDSSIESLHNEVVQLKKKFKGSLKRIIGDVKTPEEAYEILGKSVEKTEKWTKYINGTFAKQLGDIESRVIEKNIEICPGFGDHLDKRKQG